MNVGELAAALKSAGVSDRAYSLYGGIGWSDRYCASESDACDYFFTWITNE